MRKQKRSGLLLSGMSLRAVGLTAGMIAVALLSGCWTMPSLHPLYTEDSLVYEPALLGTWHGTVEDFRRETREVSFSMEPWSASSSGTQSDYRYKLSLNFDGKTTWYRGALTEIDDQMYLDIQIDEGELETAFVDSALASPYLVVPAHGIYRLSLEGNALRVDYFLGGSAVGERIENGELHLQVEPVDFADDEWDLVTASTAELRDFISRYGSEEGVFAEVATFSRQAPNAGKTEDPEDEHAPATTGDRDVSGGDGFGRHRGV